MSSAASGPHGAAEDDDAVDPALPVQAGGERRGAAGHDLHGGVFVAGAGCGLDRAAARLRRRRAWTSRPGRPDRRARRCPWSARRRRARGSAPPCRRAPGSSYRRSRRRESFCRSSPCPLAVPVRSRRHHSTGCGSDAAISPFPGIPVRKAARMPSGPPLPLREGVRGRGMRTLLRGQDRTSVQRQATPPLAPPPRGGGFGRWRRTPDFRFAPSGVTRYVFRGTQR